jgi:hypothetical protein
MPLTPYQKAFLGFDLVTKDQVVDPTTGDPVDWDSVGGGGGGAVP